MAELAIDYKKRIQQTFLPPQGNKYWRLEDLIGHNNIRYFSFGRHALAEGLIVAGVKKDDRVLLPGFICRDVLSAVNSIGAVAVYYDVGRDLRMSTPLEDLPNAKAIIAVNYFGFPQDLVPFIEYCKSNSAVLIEDNAHGLFSCDKDSKLLGTRGDVSIFSLRKTIPMPDGAALVVNNPHIACKLKPQIPFNTKHESPSFKIKQGLRRLVPLIGATSIQSVISCIRYFRKLRTSYEIYPSMSDNEYILPDHIAPCSGLLSYMASIDIVEEKIRRRELYIWVDTLIRHLDCEPVFETLHEQVVPYCYPFYAKPSEIRRIKAVLKGHSIYCLKWPALPKAIESTTHDHYKNMWLVQLLW